MVAMYFTITNMSNIRAISKFWQQLSNLRWPSRSLSTVVVSATLPKSSPNSTSKDKILSKKLRTSSQTKCCMNCLSQKSRSSSSFYIRDGKWVSRTKSTPSVKSTQNNITCSRNSSASSRRTHSSSTILHTLSGEILC